MVRFPSTDRLSSGRFSTGQNGRASLLGRTSIGKSSIGGNMSKRMSHGFDRGRTELRDSRPLSSRAFQQRCVKILYEFLTSHGYSSNITPKTLLSPTTKDFLKVFEFIVKHIEYKYKVPDKYEEEIPKYLRLLGYPFTISRSSMFAVGSPHTWPAVLAALVWLVDLVNTGLTMNEEIDKLIFPEDFDGASDSKLVFKYLVDAYKSYMSGSDSFEDLDNNFHEAFRHKYFEYEEHADSLQELQETAAMQEKDLVQMSNYLAELGIFESKLDLGEINEIKVFEAELENQLAQLKTLQTVFDNQEYTPTDVERFRMEEQQHQSQIDTSEKDIAQLDEELWNDEMSIGKHQDKLNENCGQHNKLCRILELIPVSAKNSSGLDFELKPSLLDGSTQDQFQKHKLQLLEVKNKIADEVHVANAEKRKLENVLEQELEQVEEMSNKVKALGTNLKRMEETFKSEKNLYEQSIGSKQALYDQEYEELNECHKTVQQLEHDIDLRKVELTKVQEWAAKEIEKNDKKVEEYVEFLRKVVKRVAEHKARITTCLKAASDESSVKKKKLAESARQLAETEAL
ncbi:NDC80 [Acanthosepion pharaonis]|uniref:Kinetochore protein NDC80 n=1 Tax=Acanthosepion pharaonis TaxID=158019 RepID=A0A812C0R7_ACAPH|nr:NDC80 [Sepia pharaonis]